MCHRFTPLTVVEAESVLASRRDTGRATVPASDPAVVVPDAYPGTQVPLFVPGEGGELVVAVLTWGFEGPGQSARPVFNTRIETALSHARAGRGMWANAIERGRCLVPVRAFFEPCTVSGERGAQVRFTMGRRSAFLLAGVCEGNRFSVVTTRPNAAVAPIHQRMPLVLSAGESSVWLGSGYAGLSDRTGIELEPEPV